MFCFRPKRSQTIHYFHYALMQIVNITVHIVHSLSSWTSHNFITLSGTMTDEPIPFYSAQYFPAESPEKKQSCLTLIVQWWPSSTKVVFQVTVLSHWMPFIQNDLPPRPPFCRPFSARYTPHVNTHSRHVGVSDRVRLCRTRGLSIPLQTRLPIKWRHGKEREVNGSTNNAHGRSEASNEWPHLQSLCKTCSFLTLRVTLIHIPSTHTHTHKKGGSSTVLRLLFSFSFLQPCLIPRGIRRSPVLGELRVSGGEGGVGEEGREGRVTGCNLRETPRAADCTSTCRRWKSLRQRLSWKYHSMHNQRVRVTIRYSPVYSSVSCANLVFCTRTRTVIAAGIRWSYIDFLFLSVKWQQLILAITVTSQANIKQGK